MKYSRLPGHFGTLTMRSVFLSALVNDFFHKMITFDMDIGS